RTMCHGDTRIVPVEVQEASYPVFIESFELRQDSGGPGRRRGGLGLRKRDKVITPCTMFTTFDRTACPPWGLHGGSSGAPGNVIVRSPAGTERQVLKEMTELDVGDEIIVETGGGGGFGPPHMRDTNLIEHDIENGYVSSISAS